MTNIYYRSGEPAEVVVFTAFVQSKTSATIPTYTYAYTIENWDGNVLSPSTASQHVSI